jgi:hypothetical protein
MLRIQDDFIPDPAEFHSGSYYRYCIKEKGKIFITAPTALLIKKLTKNLLLYKNCVKNGNPELLRIADP